MTHARPFAAPDPTRHTRSRGDRPVGPSRQREGRRTEAAQPEKKKEERAASPLRPKEHQGPGRALVATRTRRRGHVVGVDAHGEAVARAWHQGLGLTSWRWCARTRAGPGIPGLRRGRAVRGAPAFRARGTTRWREGDGGGGLDEQRGGSLHKNGAKAGREKGS
jgi:hypothetical protein